VKRGYVTESDRHQARMRRRSAPTRLVAMHDANAEPDWGSALATMEERLAAVWELTLECLAWTEAYEGEP
jgi:hypothetical protein